MARHHLQANRQTVHGASRNRDAGVAVNVGWESEHTVVACTSHHTAERIGQGALCVESNIRVAGGDDDVDFAKNFGHAAVEFNATSFELATCFGAVQILCVLQAVTHFWGEHVGASGPMIAQLKRECCHSSY